MGVSSDSNDPRSGWASPGYTPPAAPAREPADPYADRASAAGEPAQPPHQPTPQAPRQHPGGQLTGQYTFPALEKPPLEPLAPASLAASPISPLGLGLGVAALRRIRRTHRRGRGLAIGGIILSSLFLAATLLALATFALDGTFARMRETPVAGDVDTTRSASPVNLDVGNCVVTLPVTGEVGEVTLTPCAQEHQLQVIDRIAADGESYPGSEALFGQAQKACGNAFEELTSPVDSWPAGFTPWHLIPSEGNWDAGERNIVCFARSTSGPVDVDLVGG